MMQIVLQDRKCFGKIQLSVYWI